MYGFNLFNLIFVDASHRASSQARDIVVPGDGKLVREKFLYCVTACIGGAAHAIRKCVHTLNRVSGQYKRHLYKCKSVHGDEWKRKSKGLNFPKKRGESLP